MGQAIGTYGVGMRFMTIMLERHAGRAWGEALNWYHTPKALHIAHLLYTRPLEIRCLTLHDHLGRTP